MISRRVFYTASGAVILAVCLAGFAFFGSVLAYARSSYGQFDVFTQVLKYINDNYVETVDTDELMDGAITGMLERLDPHSNYLDNERNKRMQERNRGNFEGIGISFAILDGNLTVISAIEGTPAHRLGMRSGDIISHIEGKSAKGIKDEEVVDKLRGPRGSTVRVTVVREGAPKPMELEIVREKIPIQSVPWSFMIRPGVGYVRMTRFSATTSDELSAALDKLKKQGMEKLLLDLRGNAGGYLNEAIAVSDMFLPPGKKIVYTRGRLPDSNEDYFTTGRGAHQDYPLVVMVDRGSASASEIVSGAIQDWDRGLVVGETTFGKGLVQRQYPLRNGGALLLTVARYYTPAGRLIQRDYSDRDEYLVHRFDEEEEADVESEATDAAEESAEDSAADTSAARPEYHTSGGRIVYGGGGISPDVKIDERYPYPVQQQQLDRSRAYFEFAGHYLAQHKQTYPSFADFDRDFSAADSIVEEFVAFLDRKEIRYDSDSLQAQMDFVRRGIKSEVARTLFGDNERYQVMIQGDPAVTLAIEQFPLADDMLRGILTDSDRSAGPEVATPGRAGR